MGRAIGIDLASGRDGTVKQLYVKELDLDVLTANSVGKSILSAAYLLAVLSSQLALPERIYRGSTGQNYMAACQDNPTHEIHGIKCYSPTLPPEG